MLRRLVSPLRILPLIVAILLVFAMGCSTTEKTPKSPLTNANNSDSLVASMERTACYGQCPMYKISVFKSGLVYYEGKNFVDMIGNYSSKVDLSVLDKISIMAKNIDFHSMDETYDSEVSDFPSTITTVNADGKSKTITRRHIGPAELIQFEKDFDVLFENTAWTLIEIEE